MLDTLFIFGAKYLFVFSLILILIYFFRISIEMRKGLLIFLLFSLPLTYLTGLGARALYYNERPFVTGEFEPLISHEADNGFPSDHVLLVGSLAASLGFFNRRLGLWLWTIAAAVALSRIYVGVHHFLDVGASLAIALLCAIIVNKFYGARTNA